MKEEQFELSLKFKKDLVEIAGANIALLSEDPDSLQLAFRTVPVIFGLWQDGGEPDGIGWMILKGHKHFLNHCLGGPHPTTTGFFFHCAEQAQKVRFELGRKSEAH